MARTLQKESPLMILARGYIDNIIISKLNDDIKRITHIFNKSFRGSIDEPVTIQSPGFHKVECGIYDSWLLLSQQLLLAG